MFWQHLKCDVSSWLSGLWTNFVLIEWQQLISVDAVASPVCHAACLLVCTTGMATWRAAWLFLAYSFHYRSYVSLVLPTGLLHLIYLAVSLGNGKCLALLSRCHFHIEWFSRQPVKDWVCLCSGFGKPHLETSKTEVLGPVLPSKD